MRGILLRSPAAGWAAETFELLLPGAHAVVFGSHRIALAAEDAGFEVRDCLACLGPVRHHIWLLRKPCSEPTVAAQVLKTGTGAIWIDGCRVAGPGNVTFQRGPGDRDRQQYRTGTVAGPQVPTSLGRWPANVVLVHQPDCRNVGTRKVRSQNPVYRNEGRGSGDQGTAQMLHSHRAVDQGIGHADADGLETIAAWECAPGCSVAALDQQSGMRSSGYMAPEQQRKASYGLGGYHDGFTSPPTLAGTYGDTGGASRFFPQFANEAELDAWLLRLILG